MALNYSFGFTNSSKTGSVDYDPYVIDVSDYSIPSQSDGSTVLTNATCPIDQAETITFSVKDKASVDLRHSKVMHPAIDKRGRAVEVLLEAVLRETSTTDDAHVVDYPFTCQVSWRFPVNVSVTSARLTELLERVLGALRDSDGTGSRIDNLINGQTFPNS